MTARHHVIELRFDDETANPLLSVWRRLAEADITSVMPSAGGRPHVSLVVGTDASLPGVEAALARVCEQQDTVLVRFPYLGLFRGEVNVGFLGVAQTLELSRFHRAVFGAVEPHFRAVDEHYWPEQAVLHCTLGLDVPEDRLGEYFEIVRAAELPREGLVRAVDVVEYFPAEIKASIALQTRARP